MGGTDSKQVDATGQNVNSVIVNESLQVHNYDISTQLDIIIGLLCISLVIRAVKMYNKAQKKRIIAQLSPV